MRYIISKTHPDSHRVSCSNTNLKISFLCLPVISSQQCDYSSILGTSRVPCIYILLICIFLFKVEIHNFLLQIAIISYIIYIAQCNVQKHKQHHPCLDCFHNIYATTWQDFFFFLQIYNTKEKKKPFSN